MDSGNTFSPSSVPPPRFERNVRPSSVFRAENAPAILDVLRAEQMPCDGPWPADQIETFAGWVADGMAP